MSTRTIPLRIPLSGVNGPTHGGLATVLKEHRELWSLLQASAPDFLSEHWWVAGWFRLADDYLSELFVQVQEFDSGPFQHRLEFEERQDYTIVRKEDHDE